MNSEGITTDTEGSMAVSWSARDTEPVHCDSDIERSVYESIYHEIEDVDSAYRSSVHHDSNIEQSVYDEIIEQSAGESVYHEIEDVESTYRTIPQRVESGEPFNLLPVNNDHIQVLYQDAAKHTRTGHNQSEHETDIRCQFSWLVI